MLWADAVEQYFSITVGFEKKALQTLALTFCLMESSRGRGFKPLLSSGFCYWIIVPFALRGAAEQCVAFEFSWLKSANCPGSPRRTWCWSSGVPMTRFPLNRSLSLTPGKSLAVFCPWLITGSARNGRSRILCSMESDNTEIKARRGAEPGVMAAGVSRDAFQPLLKPEQKVSLLSLLISPHALR